MSTVEAIPRIGFLVHAFDLINHFREVWRWLDPATFDVVLVGPDSSIPPCRDALAGSGLSVTLGADVLASGQRYVTCVACHSLTEPGATERPANGYLVERLGETRVRLMYALGKSYWNFGEWNRVFDAFLVHGPRQAAALSFTGAPRIQVGYPRYDPVFRGEIDHAAVRRSLGAREGRPLVVWLPTWGPESSLWEWEQHVAPLCADMDVVVKVHPASPKYEPELVARLEAGPYRTVISQGGDSMELLAVADHVLCDYGGAPFGALILDRDLVLLDARYADKDPTLTDRSFDVELRHTVTHLSLASGASLRDTLLDTARQAAQAPIRRRLREEFVAPMYGFAGNVAALAIQGIGPIVAGRAGAAPDARSPVADWPLFNFDAVAGSLAGRRLVGWGTGGYFRGAMERHGFDLDYLVDASEARQGEEIDGVPVFPPSRLGSEDPREVFVLVFTGAYRQVYAELERLGFVYKESYF